MSYPQSTYTSVCRAATLRNTIRRIAVFDAVVGEWPMRVEHGFGPVWDAGSRVLVLGSVPSPKSREMRFYYGHPRNRFWPVMAAVFHDDGCLRECRDPDQIVGLRRDFALRHHMALWDVIESCDIDGASDASIRNAVPNDLSPIIMRSKIAHVFTTGAKAAQLYRKLCVPLLRAHGLDGMPMTQLPSTSPANAKATCPDSSKRTDASHAPFRRRRKAFPTAAALSEPYLYNRGCVEIRSVLH